MRQGRLLILLAAALAAGAILWLRPRDHAAPSASVQDRALDDLARSELELERREAGLDADTWAPERQAEAYGHFFEDLWNGLNSSSNKLLLAAQFRPDKIILPEFSTEENLPRQIVREISPGGAAGIEGDGWASFLAAISGKGWALVEAEFRQIAYSPPHPGAGAASTYYFSAHATNRISEERVQLAGNIQVEWGPGAQASPRVVDASRLVLLKRKGPAPFVLAQEIEAVPEQGSYFIDPLILTDLDGDGASEIVLPAANILLRRHADGNYAREALCPELPRLIFCAGIADFDGDGLPDLLCATFDGLTLFSGTSDGRFPGQGRLVWAANPRLKYAQCLAWGDVDGDGDTDLFLGQYKVPYDKGQMPTPYYDANDGNPSFLLLNDGKGNFSDATGGSGIKTARRVYSASFADLDADGRLDLAVVSDFAGLDLYRNLGRGTFEDVTARWAPEARAFGMAHCLADFNRDGLVDFLMIGMNSPAASRLQSMKLSRPGFRKEFEALGPMTYGNRVYLARKEGGFETPAWAESLAKSGWSWGCAAADFDNDGWIDLYVANGHESLASVRDYEPEFWLHDIYVGRSREDLIPFALFQRKYKTTRGVGQSYGGYEKNRLFLFEDGTNFQDAAFLMGVALEQDCRNVVAEDLDLDGRVDLLVTSFEAWPRRRQVLRIFHNGMADTGNWFGFAFPKQPPVGLKMRISTTVFQSAAQVVGPEGYRSQSYSQFHFGLGTNSVLKAEILWPGGKTRIFTNPPLNQYLQVLEK